MVAIVLFHLNDQWYPSGFLGVDVFFVISGYVVTPLIIESIQLSFESASLKPIWHFYQRRFFRLFPALLVTLAFFLVPLFVFSNVDDLSSISKQALYSVFGVGNLSAYTISGDYFLSGTNPLIHTWSLAVEEQIYLITPIFLILCFVLIRKTPVFYFGLILLTLISFLAQMPGSLFSQFYSLLGVAFIDEFSFYSSLNRIWQFGLGGILALTRFKSYKFSTVVIWPAFFTLVTLLTFPLFSRGAASVSASLLVGFILYARTLNRSFGYVGRFFCWLGDRSYSLYLVHMPVVYLFLNQPEETLSTRSVAIYSLVVLLILILGALQFQLIEQRMRLSTRVPRPISFRSKLLISLILVTFVSIGYLAVGTLASNRLSPLIPASLTSVKEDTHILRVSDCVDVEFNPIKCSWGKVGSAKSILLVGDSQAYGAADGFIKAAIRLNMRISVGSVSGCPFLKSGTSGRKIVDCEKFKKDVFSYIDSTKPDIVVIANRTSGYLNPDSGWRSLVTKTGKSVKSSSEAEKIYESDLINFISRIQKSSQFVLFQNIPEPENIGSPPSVWSYFVNKESYDGTVRTSFFADNSVRALEKRLSEKYNFTLFDPFAVLCSDKCISGLDVKDNFMDSWHLSTAASENLELDLIAMLQEIE